MYAEKKKLLEKIAHLDTENKNLRERLEKSQKTLEEFRKLGGTAKFNSLKL